MAVCQTEKKIQQKRRLLFYSLTSYCCQRWFVDLFSRICGHLRPLHLVRSWSFDSERILHFFRIEFWGQNLQPSHNDNLHLRFMPSQTSLKPVKKTHTPPVMFFFSTRASLSWVKRRTVKLILDKERIFSYQINPRSLGPRSACHVVLVPKRDMFFSKKKSHNLGWKVVRLPIIHTFFTLFHLPHLFGSPTFSWTPSELCVGGTKKSGGFNPSF